MHKEVRGLSLILLMLPGLLTAASREEIAEGGRLYDKWWAEYDLAKPTVTHPAYPVTGKKSGADTWRCKECHGWDYRGRDGAYATGSHYTGIRGIRRFDGAQPERVLRILKNRIHQYDRVMLEPALRLLALFVTEGQMYMDTWTVSTMAREDRHRGRELFEKECARCHDEDGRRLNFKNAEEPEFVGTVARKNPWELLHKIRNGQPGSRMPMGPGMMGRWRMGEGMPDFRDLSETEQVAIAAYAQTLPE